MRQQILGMAQVEVAEPRLSESGVHYGVAGSGVRISEIADIVFFTSQDDNRNF